MLRSAVRRRSLVAQSDDALAREAAGGGVEAFGELYRRHASVAWGVAQAVVRNPDDASDAVAEAFTKVLKTVVGAGSAGDEPMRFRPYLLTATRHAAIDVVRRRSRTGPAEAIENCVPAPTWGQPVDQVVAREEENLVVEAFARLPERWRTAMWLIDVEQLSTRDAGAVLGVEPNNAAQLAARGRARLREHFLQAHVPNHIRSGCQEVVGSLGSYLAGTASASRRAHVDDHVAGCAECGERLAHVRDLGVVLRRAILPIPLLLDRRISRAVQQAEVSASSLVEGPAARVLSVGSRGSLDTWSAVVEHLSAASPAVERLVAGVTAAAFVVGVSTAAVKTQEGGSTGDSAAVSQGPRVAGATLSQPGGPRPISASTGARGDGTGAGAATPTATGVATPPLRSVAATSSEASPTPLSLAPTGSLLAPTTDVVGPTLQGADLAGADLGGTVLRGVDLTGADLDRAAMTGADLSHTLLSGADLSGVDASGAQLRGTELSMTTLTGADLTRADLTQALARGANLAGADLSGAVAHGAELDGADLSGAVLAGGDLRGADLSGALLSRSSLTGADLTGADLRGADLRGADLTEADLSRADLRGADLTGAGLTGTNLAGADLTSAKVDGVMPLGPGATGTVLSPPNVAPPGAALTSPLSGPATVPEPSVPALTSLPAPRLALPAPGTALPLPSAQQPAATTDSVLAAPATPLTSAAAAPAAPLTSAASVASAATAPVTGAVSTATAPVADAATAPAPVT
ncbi:MAG: sigma-70 family RNA polymerase sigma factor, partial [Actinomycetota bacterium]|nr:sigma-70 family RNA polymerase sigma factor [Actinomycetota bacterium]